MRAARKPWKVRASNGNAIIAECITKRGAETEAQLSDLACVVTFEPYEFVEPAAEYVGVVAALTTERRRDHVAGWNDVKTLAARILASEPLTN